VIPATVGGVVTLVLLVLPGLAFELIRQRRRSGRSDSTFVEISRVLVAGLGLGGITITVLAGVSLIGPRSMVSVTGLITNENWLGQHLLVSGWTAWAYGLVSVTLAALVAAVLPGTNAVGRQHLHGERMGYVLRSSASPYAGGDAPPGHPSSAVEHTPHRRQCVRG
jgi:uncharacterized protein DUF6338